MHLLPRFRNPQVSAIFLNMQKSDKVYSAAAFPRIQNVNRYGVAKVFPCSTKENTTKTDVEKKSLISST